MSLRMILSNNSRKVKGDQNARAKGDHFKSPLIHGFFAFGIP